MKRKIYNRFIDWKQKEKGRVALLVEGARRIGKSYIVEAFAKETYENYLLVKSPSLVIGGTASVRCGLHSDNWRSVEPNSAWSLMSELKVQVLLFTHSGTSAAMRCLIVTDKDLKFLGQNTERRCCTKRSDRSGSAFRLGKCRDCDSFRLE